MYGVRNVGLLSLVCVRTWACSARCAGVATGPLAFEGSAGSAATAGRSAVLELGCEVLELGCVQFWSLAVHATSFVLAAWHSTWCAEADPARAATTRATRRRFALVMADGGWRRAGPQGGVEGAGW